MRIATLAVCLVAACAPSSAPASTAPSSVPTPRSEPTTAAGPVAAPAAKLAAWIGGTCVPSPLGRVILAGPIQTPVRFGDRFAGPAEIDHRDGSKGQVWLLRSDDPPLIVRVHAEQADGPGRSAFDLVRATTTRPPVVWPSGAAAFVYMPGDFGRILPTAGCWKFWLTNRADDVVTLPVR